MKIWVKGSSTTPPLYTPLLLAPRRCSAEGYVVDLKCFEVCEAPLMFNTEGGEGNRCREIGNLHH